MLESLDAMAHAAAEAWVASAASAIRDRGRFVVALSGGSTPRALYQLMATPRYARRIDWSNVHVCFGDERCVPPDDAQSNYRMTRDTLLDHVPIAAAHIHRMRGEDPPLASALAYEAELRSLFASPTSAAPPAKAQPIEAPPTDAPCFDLVLLGLGVDGHTASLFPHGDAVRESSRWVVAEKVSSVAMWRISLTPPLINRSRQVLFLVAGAEKAEAVREVLSGHRDPDQWPAQAIAPRHGRTTWLLDVSARRTPPAVAPPPRPDLPDSPPAAATGE